MAGSKEAYSQAMKEGRTLAWAMNWPLAAEQYHRALREYPDDVVAHNSLAVTLYRGGDWAGALAEYETVSRLNQQDAGAKARIAELHSRLGHPRLAIKAYLELGQMLLDQRDREKAWEAWNKAIDLGADDEEALRLVSGAIGRAGEKSLQAEVEAKLAKLVMRSPPAIPQLVTDSPTVTIESVASNVSSVEEGDGRPGPGDDELAGGEGGAGEGTENDTGSIRFETESVMMCGDGVVGRLSEGLADLDDGTRTAVAGGLSSVVQLLGAGKIRAAEDQCLELVARVPDCLPVQAMLARVYTEGRLIGDAVEKYQLLAALYEVRADWDRAAAALREIVELEPHNLTYRRKLVSLLLQMNRPLEAQSESLALVEICLAGGLDDEAAKVFAQALALGGEMGELHARYGRALGCHGRHQEAAESFARAVKLNPADLAAALALSGELAIVGDWDAMEAVFGPLYQRATSDPELLEAGLTYFQEALDRYGDDANLHYCLGMLLRVAGRREEARRQWEAAAVGEGRRVVLSHLCLGEELLADQEYGSAANHLRAGLHLVESNRGGLTEGETGPAVLKGQRLLVDACAGLGDWLGVASALERVKGLSAADEEVRSRLAETYYRLGDVAMAVQEFGELAGLYVERGQVDKAVVVYQAILQLAPSDLGMRRQLAEAYLRLGARREALLELGAVVEAQFDRGLAEDGYATLLEMLEVARGHDPWLALSIRERMVALNPGDFAVRRELVEAYLKTGRPNEALAEARAQADALLGMGRLGEAVAALKQVSVLDPWDARVLEQLGDVLHRLGQREEATKVYERLLAIQPGNPQAKANLAATHQRA